MSKHDRIIGDLVNALDAIRRNANTDGTVERGDAGRASFGYIEGIAEQAIKNCLAQQTRNADGYLVVAMPAEPTYTRAEIVNGTGWPTDARFVLKGGE